MDRKCKKLGNRATKAERYEAHQIKMGMKDQMNEYNRSRMPDGFALANQSRGHPEYGETPAEQARRMAEKDS